MYVSVPLLLLRFQLRELLVLLQLVWDTAGDNSTRVAATRMARLRIEYIVLRRETTASYNPAVL